MASCDSDRGAIAHLLRRAGFGGGPVELDEYLKLGFEGAVDRLINYAEVDDSATESKVARLRAASPAIADPKKPSYGNLELEIASWLMRMLFTRRPLQEKMTLFWHGHFATSDVTVNSSNLMSRQNSLFRTNALPANFKGLADKVAHDPAMLIYLNNYANRKGNPNENWARELMELFTLGIGNYTETDVKEAARAFTGWTVDAGKEFLFDSHQHDTGTKTFLGTTGNLDGGDVIEGIFAHPAHPGFIASKLFRYFIYNDPSSATIEPFTRLYRESGFNIKELVRAILLSPEFRSERAQRALIKSPVEYVIGAMKSFSATLESFETWKVVAWAMNTMGQYLYYPPDVAGWRGNRDWINSTTYLNRANFAAQMLASKYIKEPSAVAEAAGATSPEAIVDFFLDLLLQCDSLQYRKSLLDLMGAGSGQDKVARVRGLVRTIMASPAYQMN